MMRKGASKGKEKTTKEEEERKREKRSRQKVRIQEVKQQDQEKEKEETIKEREWEQERQKEREASIEDRQRKIRKRESMTSPLEPRQGKAEGNSHSNQACEALGEEGARLAQKGEICRDDEQGARKEEGKIEEGGAPQLSMGAVPRKVAECLGKWVISARRGDFQRADQRGNRSMCGMRAAS